MDQAAAPEQEHPVQEPDLHPSHQDTWLQDAPWLAHRHGVLKGMQQVSQHAPGEYAWHNGVVDATGQLVSVRVYDISNASLADKLMLSTGGEKASLLKGAEGAILKPTACLKIADKTVAYLHERHDGCLLDVLRKDLLNPADKLQVHKGMRDVMQVCSDFNFHPQLNAQNLVLLAKGVSGKYLQEPHLRLAGVEQGCYGTRSGNLNLTPSEKARSDILAGIQANCVICSPAEAAAFLQGKTGYLVTQDDMVFRGGLAMALVETGVHPFGSTGEAQLRAIAKLAEQDGPPQLQGVASLSLKLMLEHMLHGNPSMRMKLAYVRNNPAFYTHNATQLKRLVHKAADITKSVAVGSPAHNFKKDWEARSASIFGVRSIEDIFTHSEMEAMEWFDNPDLRLQVARPGKPAGWKKHPPEIAAHMRNTFDGHLVKKLAYLKHHNPKFTVASVYLRLNEHFPGFVASLIELAHMHDIKELKELLRSNFDDGGEQASSLGKEPEAGPTEANAPSVWDVLSKLPVAPDAATPPAPAAPGIPGDGDSDEVQRQAAAAAAAGRATAVGARTGVSVVPAAAAVDSQPSGLGSLAPHHAPASPPAHGPQLQQQQQQSQGEAFAEGRTLSLRSSSRSPVAGDHVELQLQIPSAGWATADLPAESQGSRGSAAASRDSGATSSAAAPGTAMYKAWALDAPPGSAVGVSTQACRCQFGAVKNSMLPKLLRSPNVIAYMCSQASYAEEHQLWTEDAVASLRMGLLQDMIYGSYFGPCAVVLATKILRAGLDPACDDYSVHHMRQAAGYINASYSYGDALPAGVEPALADELRLMLPLSRLLYDAVGAKAVAAGSRKKGEDLQRKAIKTAVQCARRAGEQQALLFKRPLTHEQQTLQTLLVCLESGQFWNFIHHFSSAGQCLQQLFSKPLEQLYGPASDMYLQTRAFPQFMAGKGGEVDPVDGMQQLMVMGVGPPNSHYLPVFDAAQAATQQAVLEDWWMLLPISTDGADFDQQPAKQARLQ